MNMDTDKKNINEDCMADFWHTSTDVIVIGSGAAGLSAAIEARQKGAAVMVFEKMPVVGGNTRISDGGLSAPGNFMQKRLGITDSARMFYDDIMRAGLGLNHPELVKIFAQNASDAIDWTRQLGVQYQDRLDKFGGHCTPRCVTIQNNAGRDIIKAQIRRLDQMQVPIHTRHALEGLITDDSGTVAGVRIRSCSRGSGSDLNTGSDQDFGPAADAGQTMVQHIRARRAVVLATGGFSSDVAFRSCQNPRLDAALLTTNHKGATAEGLVAALRIHAMPVHLSWIQLGPWGCADETGYGKGSRFASYSIFPTGILVDPATGSRIVNEWADRRQRSDAMLATGHICAGIVDAQGAQKDPDSLAHCLKTQKAKPFDSLTRLAEAWQMPPDALEKTVSEYNHMVRTGTKDQFGKLPHKNAVPIGSPPFYAMGLWPKVHYTPGGLQINKNARVMDLTHRPIGHLFAAGEVTGGIHGAGRLGGCALPECIVFGRIAGQQAATMNPKC
jgi:flavocytochrome c